MSTLLACEAGSSPITTDEETKRHSKSLDLGNSNSRLSSSARHQRSASESDGLEIMKEVVAAVTAVDKVSIVAEQSPSMPSSNSVFSLYKKLGRKTSLHAENKRSQFSKSRASIGSAFSSFRQPSLASISRKSLSNRGTTPVSADADHTMNEEQATIVAEEAEEDQEQSEEKRKSTFPSYLLEQTGSSKRSLPSSLQQEINQFSIDGFARKYFATHKRGLFRRTVPMNELLRWTKDSIKQPLLLSNCMKKESLKCFKTIQMLMHDRPRPRNFDFITNFQSLLDVGITQGQMRDEIYVQICRQLNKNPRGASIKKGWEILCVISVAFPPSKNLESYLFKFVEQHHDITENQVDVMSHYVSAKLHRICSRGARGKVLSPAEIERAMEAPFKPSVFGEPLDFIMEQERNTDLMIPQIVEFLTQAVLDLNGKTSEGIFRVPGDADAVTELRIRIENGNYDLNGIDDPNVPASLLKYWLRDLSEPLIPSDLYQQCIDYANDKAKSVDIMNCLPVLNRRITFYMIQFLQDFADPEVIEHTLMNVFNLAMVFAPNFLRCPSVDLTTIFENSKYEQIFLKTLITHLQVDKDACAHSHIDVIGKIKDDA